MRIEFNRFVQDIILSIEIQFIGFIYVFTHLFIYFSMIFLFISSFFLYIILPKFISIYLYVNTFVYLFIFIHSENNRARLANELVPESIIAVLKTHLGSEVFVKEACRYVRAVRRNVNIHIVVWCCRIICVQYVTRHDLAYVIVSNSTV